MRYRLRGKCDPVATHTLGRFARDHQIPPHVGGRTDPRPRRLPSTFPTAPGREPCGREGREQAQPDRLGARMNPAVIAGWLIRRGSDTTVTAEAEDQPGRRWLRLVLAVSLGEWRWNLRAVAARLAGLGAD